MSEGTKHDHEKPMVQLIDPIWQLNVAKVLTKGAQKYEAENWRKGLAVSRLIGAAERHLLAIKAGEFFDPEWGLPHTAHLSCEAMFLEWTLMNRPECDDRWYKGCG